MSKRLAIILAASAVIAAMAAMATVVVLVVSLADDDESTPSSTRAAPATTTPIQTTTTSTTTTTVAAAATTTPPAIDVYAITACDKFFALPYEGSLTDIEKMALFADINESASQSQSHDLRMYAATMLRAAVAKDDEALLTPSLGFAVECYTLGYADTYGYPTYGEYLATTSTSNP